MLDQTNPKTTHRRGLAAACLAGLLVSGLAFGGSADARRPAPSTATLTWSGKGTTTVGSKLVPSTSVCGVENGAPVDGGYVTFVLSSTKSVASPTITISGGTAQSMSKANGTKIGTSSFRYLLEGRVDLDALSGQVVVQFSGGGTPILTLGQGCVVSGKSVLAGWGSNRDGQLGRTPDGGTNVFAVPLLVDDTQALFGKTVTAATGGNYHSCAIADGAAYCWGTDNLGGQLGTGDYTISGVTPLPVVTNTGLSNTQVTAIDAGSFHTCAISAGSAYCWGFNEQAQLGYSGANSPSPVAVSIGATPVTAVSAGDQHSCAVAGGAAYCWGNNQYGQLGNGTITDSPTPVLVSGFGGKTVTAIAAGIQHTCAIADGAVYCWGENEGGRLGDGTETDSSTPVLVSTTGTALSGVTATAVSVGLMHSCALASGVVSCWGWNNEGQLGSGSGDFKSLTPQTTAGALSGKTVTAFASSGYANCAVAGSAAYCWGYNASGLIGDGTTTTRTTPVAVDTTGILSGVTVHGVALSGSHALAW